ncbi:MAG TPA: DUF6691 family protein [Burkholderiaceae bacterium]|jgi:hypothetical protein
MNKIITAAMTAAFAGLIFGLGLLISGMSNPAKVLGSLDLAGAWDPSLALVMAGAIGVGSIGFALAKKRTRSWLDEPMQLPASKQIDRRLVLGSLAFGAGWGLAGFCPGPALVAAAQGYGSALLFTGAMLVGMAIFAVLERR